MRTLRQGRSTPFIYLITDRKLVPCEARAAGLTCLIDFIQRALDAGVDMIQIREPDVPTRELAGLTAAVQSLAAIHDAALLVNDRADVAACRNAGVHLTTRSLKPDVVRRIFGGNMLIGASTHSIDEVRAAEQGGADFVVFGPVFETASKTAYGNPLGVEALRRVVRASSIPVLALGGVDLSNFRATLDAGATGVAGISMFTSSRDLPGLVAAIKGG